MRSRVVWATSLMVMLLVCGSNAADSSSDPHVTTAGIIAIENLEHQIAQNVDSDGTGDLLLLKSRFLGDYEALDRASTRAEMHARSSSDLLRRARTRSAVHRFADALSDLAAAEQAGASPHQIVPLHAAILVATGRAREVVGELEEHEICSPGFASRTALAGAYAAVNRLEEADRLYAEALDDLNTTSPFPFAWIYFARAKMWVEQGRDNSRGEAMYRQSLTFLPDFVAANIELAELEMKRGDLESAKHRLEHVTAISNEPEALELLGELHVRTNDPMQGWREISLARQRFEALLAQYPLAFADHAAEFYLGPGADAERAWVWAQLNLANRQSERAFALAIKTAQATRRGKEAQILAERAAESRSRR